MRRCSRLDIALRRYRRSPHLRLSGLFPGNQPRLCCCALPVDSPRAIIPSAAFTQPPSDCRSVGELRLWHQAFLPIDELPHRPPQQFPLRATRQRRLQSPHSGGCAAERDDLARQRSASRKCTSMCQSICIHLHRNGARHRMYRDGVAELFIERGPLRPNNSPSNQAVSPIQYII